MAEEKEGYQNSITITGKKKFEGTEISYQYKVYFDSTAEQKAMNDVALAEKLIAQRSQLQKKEADYPPINPKGGLNNGMAI